MQPSLRPTRYVHGFIEPHSRRVSDGSSDGCPVAGARWTAALTRRRSQEVGHVGAALVARLLWRVDLLKYLELAAEVLVEPG